MSFDPPKSRNEAILQNMLGANNVLETPKSREEELLLQILQQGGTGGGVTPEQIEAAVEAYLEEHPVDAEPFEIPVTRSGSTYTTTATAADILANRNNCVAVINGDRISATYVDYASATKVSIIFSYTFTGYNQLGAYAYIVSVDGSTVTVTQQAASSMVVPVPTNAESEGDFLRLDNNKIPVWQTVPSAESNSFGGGS